MGRWFYLSNDHINLEHVIHVNVKDNEVHLSSGKTLSLTRDEVQRLTEAIEKINDTTTATYMGPRKN